MVFGAVTWPGYEPAYIARELGLLEEDRVHLAEFTNSTEVLRAFRNGQMHVAALTLDEALELRRSVPDLQIFLVTDFSNGADLLMVRHGISKLGQLRGKRIGVEKTALGAYYLSLILQEARLDSSSVNIISLPLDEHVRAFREGRVDAVVTFAPVEGKLKQEGAEILFDSSKVPGKIVDTLVVRASVIDEQRTHLRYFIKAWFKGLEAMEHDREFAYPFIAKREQMSVAQVATTLGGLRLADRQTNIEQLNGNPPMLLKTGMDIQHILESSKLATGSDDLLHLINPALFQEAGLD